MFAWSNGWREFIVALMMSVSALELVGSRGLQNQPSTSTTVQRLGLSGPTEHLGKRAREPMIVEHPSGVLFVAGYGEDVPTLWKSTDSGKTWQLLDVGTTAQGAVGNSDVDLAVAADGTLYFVAMQFDRKTFEGVQIAVGVSRDAGTKWSWSTLSKTRFDDRPWVEVAPNGDAHVIWNDGAGVRHAISRDRGTSWTELQRIHERGGSSHMAIGPGGELAVRVTPASASGHKYDLDVDLIAVSTDNAKTWQKRAVPGSRVWLSVMDKRFGSSPEHIRWVEPVAWGSTGALYSFWSEGQTLWLAQSRDRGETWRQWKVADVAEGAYFPYLAAGGPGELAATWFSGKLGEHRANVARISVSADSNAPVVRQTAPFAPDTWTRGQTPGAARTRDTGGEYFPVTFLRDGSLVAITTVQDDQRDRFGFGVWTAERQQ